MADTVKISALTEISSGALDDNSVVPVVDGGVTYKLPISKLKAFVGDSFATDTELSNQISVVNSTINGLDTGDISEGSRLYYTDARVKTKLNAEGVVSGSVTLTTSSITNFPTEVSRSAAAAGFSAGGGVTDGTISSSQQISDFGIFAELEGDGLVSSSQQISDYGVFVQNSVTSSMTVVTASYAITAAYAENAGGGSGNDYISNVSYATSQLTFTGVGSGFDGVITLPFLPSLTYTADSASFQSRISSLSGGSTPNGTISSSQQISDFGIFAELNGDSLVSSSEQIVVANADLTGLDTDDIGQGITNLYYTDNKVLSYINTLGVVSGSVSFGDGTNGLISSSEQIDALGFVTDAEQTTYSSSVASRFDTVSNLASSYAKIDVTNNFSAEQIFEFGAKLTGSFQLTGGSFSGSGANLFNIPGTAIVGGVPAGTQLVDGDSSVTVDADSGVTIQAASGSITIAATTILNSGSFFSGSGAGLFDIPGSAIIGGVASGNNINSGSVSASISPNFGFTVNTSSNFNGDMIVSGSIIADEISVGSTGTPTLYSSTNINLSASNAVVITDSPLRLSPQSDVTTGSFSLSNGDIVYSSTTHDFYGYKSGSWVSLTEATADAAAVSYLDLTNIPTGIVSSSVQVTNTGITDGDILFSDIDGNITSSTSLSYERASNTLSVGTVSATNLSYTGTFTGVSGTTGSFGRLLADSLRINNAVELPNADGSANQVLKTDGSGNVTFATVETLITTEDITSAGTFTMGTGSVGENLTVGGTINSQILGPATTILEAQSLQLKTDGQLLLSSSAEAGVLIDDILVLKERDFVPTTPETGSIVVSGSSAGLRPYFFDGNGWIQMFA